MKQTDSSDEFTISGWFKTDMDYNDKGMLTGITGENSYIYLDILADGKLKLAMQEFEMSRKLKNKVDQ